MPTCYSPVCHSTQGPKAPFAFDLHALSTPPAFVLSQDQTLHCHLILCFQRTGRGPIHWVFVFGVRLVTDGLSPSTRHDKNCRLSVDGLSKSTPRIISAGKEELYHTSPACQGAFPLRPFPASRKSRELSELQRFANSPGAAPFARPGNSR